MTKKILKQLWNERRGNAWLFVELVVISIFLWQAIDPFYTYNALLNFPDGCDYDEVYELQIIQDERMYEEYNWKEDINEFYRMQSDVHQVYKGITAFPEIDVACINQYSIASNYMRQDFFIDSIYTADGKEKRVNITVYSGDGDFIKVFRIKDYFTGEIMEPLNYMEVYISHKTAIEAFGTAHCIGKKIGSINFMGNVGGFLTVKGVYMDIKENAYALPIASMITVIEDNTISGRSVALRLKKGVNKDDFVEKLNNNSAYRVKTGAFECGRDLRSYNQVVADHSIAVEQNNHYFQLFLTSFALFCAFLGIVSTFWIRSSARRSDIGIMRSMGASRLRIVWQFITEALLLVTIAFAVALPLIIHIVATNDFAQPIDGVSNEQLAEHIKSFAPLPRFAVITVATYLIIAITAVIAAVIPASRTCKTTIANTLKEN